MQEPKKKLMKWLPEDDRMLTSHFDNNTIPQLAQLVNRPFRAVEARCYRLGLKRRVYHPPIHWTPEMDEVLKSKYQRMDYETLGKEMGVTVSQIARRLQKLKLKKTGVNGAIARSHSPEWAEKRIVRMQQAQPPKPVVRKRPPAQYSNPDYNRLLDYYSQQGVNSYFR